MTVVDRREGILQAADRLLADRPDATIEDVARAARVSRATFYRHFRSRDELLEALDITPDPGSRDRILAAAAELIGRDGLRSMSMDELASAAGVSRASVYRLFPGKAALFDALMSRYSPFDEIAAVLDRMADRPADEGLPAIAHAAAGVAAPRIGILRTLFFEVTSGQPEALIGAEPRIVAFFGKLAHYLAGEMAAGRLRPMPPMLAAQLLIGPIFFHLFTRAEAERLAVMPVPLEAAIDALVQASLRGLAPAAGHD